MGRLDGKVTLITGGALGLGEAMARMMAREGAKIAVADLKETEGRTVADAIGGLFVRLDVSKEDE